MNITIDGVIYENQAYGGVSRIFDEILPRICELDPTLMMSIITSGTCKRKPPITHRMKWIKTGAIEKSIRPARMFWWSIIQPLRTFKNEIYLRDEKKSIWHSTYYTYPYNWKGPVVITAYDCLHELFPHLFTRVVDKQFIKYKEKSLKRADAIICISRSTKQDLIDIYGVNSQKIFVVPLSHSKVFHPSSEVNVFQNQELNFTTEKPFFLYVGGRQHYKNFDLLLNSFAKFPYKDQYNLVVVGNRWSKSEELRLSEMNVKKDVILLNNIDDNYLCQLYNRATAFVYPSIYEGFGIPILEAMSCGCPVIASKIPSSIEIADDAAFYFEPMDEEMLTGLFSLVHDEGESTKKIQKGLAIASKFSWDRNASQTFQLYRELTSSFLLSE